MIEIYWEESYIVEYRKFQGDFLYSSILYISSLRSIGGEGMIVARIGAIIYVLWGLLHIVAAFKVYTLGQGIEPGMVQGRVYQNAWSLLFFAVFSIVVAIKYNWNNSKLGYWLNLVVVSVVDIGFIIIVLVPGYLPLVPGALGPLLWLLALAFSTMAIRRANET